MFARHFCLALHCCCLANCSFLFYHLSISWMIRNYLVLWSKGYSLYPICHTTTSVISCPDFAHDVVNILHQNWMTKVHASTSEKERPMLHCRWSEFRVQRETWLSGNNPRFHQFRTKTKLFCSLSSPLLPWNSPHISIYLRGERRVVRLHRRLRTVSLIWCFCLCKFLVNSA